MSITVINPDIDTDQTTRGLASLVVAAGDMILATGPDAFTTTPSTSYGRSLLALASVAANKTALDAASWTTRQNRSVVSGRQGGFDNIEMGRSEGTASGYFARSAYYDLDGAGAWKADATSVGYGIMKVGVAGIAIAIGSGTFTQDQVITPTFYEGLRIITSSATWAVGAGQTYETLDLALAAAQRFYILPTVFLSLDLIDGTYAVTTGWNLAHPCGAQMRLIGNTTTPANVTFELDTSAIAVFTINYNRSWGFVDGIKILHTDLSDRLNTFGFLMDEGGQIVLGDNMIIDGPFWPVFARRNGTVRKASSATGTHIHRRAGDCTLAYQGGHMTFLGALFEDADDLLSTLGSGTGIEGGSADLGGSTMDSNSRAACHFIAGYGRFGAGTKFDNTVAGPGMLHEHGVADFSGACTADGNATWGYQKNSPGATAFNLTANFTNPGTANTLGLSWDDSPNVWKTLYNSSVASTTVTGTLVQQDVVTITIPAGAMGANGRIRWTASWKITNTTASNKFLQTRIGGGGGTILETITVTANITARSSREVANVNNVAIQKCFGGVVGGFGLSNSAHIAGAINTAAATTLVFSITLADITDSASLEELHVELYKAA